MIRRSLAFTLALAQAVLGLRVAWRLARSGGEAPLRNAARPLHTPGLPGTISVIVPVLDEADRLKACLEHLVSQSTEVAEILVVDGGSRDATRALVQRFTERDVRLRLLEVGAAPAGWNGKVWGLHCAERAVASTADWVLLVDADVRLASRAAAVLADRAATSELGLASVATAQQLASPPEAIVHASLLTTLVYRFGRPGTVTRDANRALANGQCLLIRRDVLRRLGGFESVRTSLCEDVTLARLAARNGQRVGFYESTDVATVQMYARWQETWRNWPRSLAVRDGLSGRHGWLGLLEVTLVQSLPLALLIGRGSQLIGRHSPRGVLHAVNVILLLMRLGMLLGIARAYPDRPWTYWLSPLVDVASSIELWRAALASHQSWRGRSYTLQHGQLVASA